MLYDYEDCLLIIRAMIERARRDMAENKYATDAYLFLRWCELYLVAYIEDLEE